MSGGEVHGRSSHSKNERGECRTRRLHAVLRTVSLWSHEFGRTVDPHGIPDPRPRRGDGSREHGFARRAERRGAPSGTRPRCGRGRQRRSTHRRALARAPPAVRGEDASELRAAATKSARRERDRNPTGGYRLVAPGDAIDADRFEALIRRGRTAAMDGTPARAAAALDEAIRLWRGRPYSELAGWDPADGEAARLTELHRVATEDFIDAELACGRHSAHVADLEAMVAAEPLRERRWAMLMLALYRSGQQADALRAYQRARIALAEELGIEPGPELRDMERAVIAQDESLGAPPRWARLRACGVQSDDRVGDDRERDGVVHRHGGFDRVGVEPGARRRRRAASRALLDLASGGRRGGRHRGEEPG